MKWNFRLLFGPVAAVVLVLGIGGLALMVPGYSHAARIGAACLVRLVEEGDVGAAYCVCRQLVRLQVQHHSKGRGAGALEYYLTEP